MRRSDKKRAYRWAVEHVRKPHGHNTMVRFALACVWRRRKTKYDSWFGRFLLAMKGLSSCTLEPNINKEEDYG